MVIRKNKRINKLTKGDVEIHPQTANINMNDTPKLGFTGLVALVFSMMVGAGIFNLPQNMASSAGAGATVVAWVITAVIILALVITLKRLSDRYPEMDGGIYEYGRAGWGNYVGFNIAWGYWLSACFANVAYTVMLSDTAGAFFPVFLNHGWPMVLLASAIIAVMYVAVCSGLKVVKTLNMCISVFKIVAIGLIIALLAIYMDLGMFTSGFWSGGHSMSGLWEQVRGSMMVTLWCFIGVEGALMVSSRARKARDVGKAGITGCILAWVLYLLVSVLSYGIMQRSELSTLGNPSAAYLLKSIAGNWAYYTVIVTVVVAVTGGLVSWTLVLGDVARQASLAKIFPRKFSTLNRLGMPQYSLRVSSILMICFIVLVAMADDVYLAALNITGMMVLPAYLTSGLYLIKLIATGKWKGSRSNRIRSLSFATISSAGMLWMIYSGGLELLLETSVFYAIGIPFFIIARKQYTPRESALFSRKTVAAISVIAFLAVATAAYEALK